MSGATAGGCPVTALGLYVPGSSPVHRAPAGAKLRRWSSAGIGSVLLDEPWQVASPRWRRARLLRRAGLTPLHGLRASCGRCCGSAWSRPSSTSWSTAGSAPSWWSACIAVLVLLAALVTLTTRTTDLVDALVAACRPLRVVGVDPERVGLMIALGIRCVPVVVGLAEEVRDAQRARGLTASPRAFAVPLIVRSLRHADALGEALAARGLDD